MKVDFIQEIFGIECYMRKIITCIIFIVFISILGAFYLQGKLAPITDRFVESKAKFIGNKIINDTIIEMTPEMEEFFILEKNEEGRIISARTNSMAMNLFKSRLHNRLNEKFGNIADNNFNVPILNIVGFDWMSGLGPKIPVRLLFNGSIFADFENEFIAAGINQTKHIIYINTKAEVWAVISGRQILCQIENKMPIAETVVMGDVPGVYFNGIVR